MISGYLLINKPVGMTSHDVVDAVRKISGQREVGHAGTLDPMAEGLLIILLGQYTKKSIEFMKLEKEYLSTFILGETSDTDDMEGNIIKKENLKIPDLEAVKAVLRKFTGKIQQVPPQYSAIKVGGKKAYSEARAGRKLEILPKEVEIKEINVESYSYPNLTLLIKCGSGTYIRSLARDIGQELGVGALMGKLKRLKIGEYNLEGAIKLNELNEETIYSSLSNR